MYMFYKLLGKMVNSLDPDQTSSEVAVWSGSALFVYTILSEKSVYKIYIIRTITVMRLHSLK